MNTDNEADRRVYDILSKKFELFEGVFGASDVALGALESGVSFEKRILDIYQNCKNITAVRKAFAALNRQLDARKNAHVAELRSILLTESREAKGQALEKTKADIDKYLRDVEYWNQFEEPEVDHKLHYWKIDNWGEKIFGSHGVLFLGAFMDNTKLLFPVLLLCDENGEYINFTEDEIVSALEESNDSDVRYFKPTDEEQSYFHRIYARLISEVQDQHDKTVAPTIAYNKKKIENWVDVQQEQLHVQLTDAQKEVLKEDLMDKITRQVRIEHWTQIMNECLNSGMNKTEWCRANGISDKQFFYWQRILRKEAFAASTSKDLSVITDPADETSPQKISFAEISIPIKQESVRNGFHPDIILRKGPVSVEISNSVSAELLSRIGDIFHAE